MTTTTAPAPAGVPTSSDPRRWWVLAVLSATVLVVTLDNTVLSVAVPSLARDLRLSAAGVQWVVEAYSLVFAGLLVTAGVLTDRFGRRRGLVAGLVVFGFGSLLASFAASGAELVAARALMGVGGAFLMPGTLSLLVHTFDEDERRTAIGVWSGVSALGIAAGPIIGGLIVHHLWWGAVFLVNVPVVLVAVVAALLLVRESRDRQAPVPDLPGALLSTAGIVGLVYAVVEAPTAGWLSARVVAAATAGVLALAGFLGWIRRSPHPMIEPALLRNRRLLGAATVATLLSFGLAGSTFLIGQYLQFVLGYDALGAGLRTAPVALAVMLTAPFSGAVAKRLGDPMTVAIGLAVAAGGFAVTGALAGSETYAVVLAGLMLLGAGAGLAMGPASNALMAAVPADRAGAGSAINDTAQELGGTLGVAVLGSVLAAGFRAGLPAGTPESLLASPADAVSAVAAGAGEQFAAVVRQALDTGIGHGLLAGSAAILLAALASPRLLSR